MPGDVTVVIPNWNGADRLERVLETLSLQTEPPGRVLVVDNGSTDGSVNAAERWGAEVLRLGRNYGFSRAVNEGVKVSETPWIAVVNNDVELDAEWLRRLRAAADAPDVWFACCKLLSLSDPSRLDGCYDLMSRSGCAWRVGHGCLDSPAFRLPAKVWSAPFTAALFRSELFQRVGLLDERFESYLEDVDFGVRCALAGLGGVYVPEAVARHQGSATLGAWSPRMVELISRNQVLIVAKHYPQGWVRRLGRAVLVGQLLWGGLAVRHGAAMAWLRGKCRGFRMFAQVRGEENLTKVESLEGLLRSNEEGIRELQAGNGVETFWRAYFRLSG